jgi:hypothetical protein
VASNKTIELKNIIRELQKEIKNIKGEVESK